MTAAPVLPPAFDPTDPAINEIAIPLDEFAELRRTAPVHWVEQPPASRAGFLDTGYWAHLAARMKPWDRVEIRAADGTCRVPDVLVDPFSAGDQDV